MVHLSHKQIASVLEELRHLVESDGIGSLSTEIDEEIQKLRENRFYLVALGQFKRGKTTLLNALLGEELLPVGVLPLTTVVTLICHGPQKRAEVIFSDLRRREIDLSELADYVAEQGNPRNQKNVRYVEIHYPADLLRDGLVLVDTPGIGSLSLHNTETTQDFIPKVDAAILVLSPDPPITQIESEFLDEILQHVDRLFVVLNKTDLLTDSDLRETVAYTQSILREKLKHRETEVYPLSALRALQGKTTGQTQLLKRSNIESFDEALQSFLEHEKLSALLQRTAQRAHDLISRARFGTELELQALQTPLLELEAKIREFDLQVNTLLLEREHFDYLLQAEVKSLEQWIDKGLEHFAGHEINVLKEILPTWGSVEPWHSFDQFVEALELQLAERLISDLEDWRRQHEEQMIRRYESIIDRYAQKTNEVIRQIVQLSANLFDTKIQPFSNFEPFKWQKRFYYRVEDESVFLELDLLKIVSPLLPKRLLRRLLLNRVGESIEPKVEQNCGGLRYEYSYSLEEAHRGFQYDLSEKLDTIISEIRVILQHALQRRASGEKAIEAKKEELAARFHKMDELRHRIVITP
jgi:GTPase SAR1 family protein